MSATSPSQPPRRPGVWLGAGVLLLGLVLAYQNSLNGPFVFDDLPAIIHNPSIRQLWPLTGVLSPDLGDGGVTVSGRPLVNLSLALNYAWGGEAVVGYHVANLLIHAAAGLLLFGVIRRTLVRAPVAPQLAEAALPLAVAGATLWVLHPLQTAAVTYVVQRAEAMMGLCYLLTLYAFIRATEKPETGNLKPEEGRLSWLALSVGACLAGMACKEVMVGAPLMVLLYDRTFGAGSFRAAWRLRWKYYAGLGLTWLLLGFLVAGTQGRGSTAGFGVEVSPWTYALTQCEAIIHYLRLVVWPQPLVFDYGIATVDGLGAVWWQAVAVVGGVSLAVLALVRRPAVGFVVAWFLVVLAPSSSVVPVATQTIAEHRMYLALAAPLLAAVLALYQGLGRLAWPVLGLLALGCGVLTHARNADYATAHGLWADTLAKRPGNGRAHHNLGLAEQARGRLAEAEQHLRAAVAAAPGSPEPVYNLAVLANQRGRPEEAMALYREVLRMAPDHAAAHNNLANLLHAAGHSAEAGHHYAEAVRVQPDFAGARNSYGAWLIDARRPAEALLQLEEAIRLQPEVAEMYFNAGNAAAALGRFEAAAAFYRTALRKQPEQAETHNNLGNILLELDRLPEALEEFETALRLRPDYFEPRRTLALLYLLHLQRPAEARRHLEILARAQPANREIADALARARAASR